MVNANSLMYWTSSFLIVYIFMNWIFNVFILYAVLIGIKKTILSTSKGKICNLFFHVTNKILMIVSLVKLSQNVYNFAFIFVNWNTGIVLNKTNTRAQGQDVKFQYHFLIHHALLEGNYKLLFYQKQSPVTEINL